MFISKQPHCIKCNGTTFEISERQDIRGTDLIWFFVQCANCGGVVGVLDYHTHTAIMQRLEAIEKKLRV